MFGAEQYHRLIDQSPVRSNLLGLSLQKLCLIRPDVQCYFVAEIPLPLMRPGKHRAVDQSFETGHAVIDPVA